VGEERKDEREVLSFEREAVESGDDVEGHALNEEREAFGGGEEREAIADSDREGLEP
jgi:hypothetical protein